MLKAQAMILMLCLLGYLLRKLNVISNDTRRGISDLVLTVMLPCTIFNSFRQKIDVTQIQTLIWVLLTGVGVCMISWLFSHMFYHSIDPSKRTIMQFGTLISNFTFVGLPVVEATYGSAGLVYAAIFAIPLRFCTWTIGAALFIKDQNRSRQYRRALLNPCFLAVFAGLAWMFLDLPMLSIGESILKSLGSCSTPLSLIVVGTILGDVPFREALNWKVFYVTAIRLLLLPGIVLITLWSIGFDPMGTAAAVILTGMPIATVTVLFAEKYGKDAVFASQCVFLSTLLSLVTVPALVLLMQLLIRS
jgi:predicted permease